MVQIEKELEKITRAKELIKTTKSPYLKRDMQKYVRRAEKQLRQALRYMEEAKRCHAEHIPTASQT